VWLRDCGRWHPDRLPIWATLRPHEPASMRPSGADRRAGHRRLNRAPDVSGASVNARQRGRFRASMNTRAGTRDARPPSCLLAWLPLLARSPASPYAFAAAFRRHHGIPSGAWRQQHSTEPLTLNGAEDTAPPAEPDESRLNGGFGDIDAAQVRSSLLRLPAMGGFYRHVNRFLENAVCATRNSSATQITASAIRLAVVMCSRTRIPGFSNGRMRQWQTPGLPSVI